MNKKKTTPETPIGTSNDLDQLRNILYGNQARETEQRLSDLETRLETIQREFSADLNEHVAAMSGAASTELEETQRTFNNQLDKLSTEFKQRLDKQIDHLSQRLTEFRTEARQRDDDLRQEMLALGAMLDKQKTGRAEFGELLVQLGQQLQDNSQSQSSSE